MRRIRSLYRRRIEWAVISVKEHPIPFVIVVLGILSIALAVFGWVKYWDPKYWDWVRTAGDSVESGSTTIRNLGLVIAGLIALPLAIWRSVVAHKEANVAQQGLWNERYQKGAEMLGSAVLSVRLGGIYALRKLAEEHPEQYHIQIMELFCAFVRNPTNDNDIEFHPERDERRSKLGLELRMDVQEVMKAIGSRSSAGHSIERSHQYRLYLHDADISRSQLLSANLSDAWLSGANLSGAMLHNADLSGAMLRDTDLSGARLDGVFHVQGLTQAQLDEARADPNYPPRLQGLSDAETGEPLVWRGKSLDERAPLLPLSANR